MKIELYQAETEKTCLFHEKLLEQAYSSFYQEKELSDLEFQGVIHSLQVLIENAIGKAKHLLKYHKMEVPVSAYDAFEYLLNCNIITKDDFKNWKSIVGLRNTIVHEYMNVESKIVINIIKTNKYKFITKFLKNPFSHFPAPT